jgi:gamma-glutamyltranspeptidase/glutathione hydrolase
MGSGFLLNNEMDDFSARPGSPNGFGLVGGVANSIEARKRPLSSMTPTIVFDPQGNPLLVTGSPGGSTIITVVLQLILNVLEFDMGIAEASAASRIHHQWLPDDVYYESGISPDTLRKLREMGHLVSDGAAVLGSTQSIQSSGKGVLFGATDSRAHGAGVAIQP